MAEADRTSGGPGHFATTVGAMLWQYGTTLGQFAFQLVVLAILARLLTPEAFGLMGVATVVAAFASLATRAGIGQALIQRPEIDDLLVRTAFTLSLLAGALVGGTVWLASGRLAGLFNEPGARGVIELVCLSFVALGIGSTAEALLQREMRFRAYGIVTAASYVFGYGLVAVPLAVAGFGVWSLAIATVTQAAAKSALAIALRPHPIAPSLAVGPVRQLLGFGGGVTVSKALNTLALQADYVLVGRMLGVEALGIYNRSYQLMLIPVNLVGQAVSAVLLPSLSKVQGEPAKLREAYLTTTAMMAVLGNVAAVLFVVLAPEIVMLVLGPQWGRAVAPFQLLSFVLTLRIAYKLDDTLAKAVAAIRARMVRDALYATAVIVGVAFGVRWGVSGAAAAIAGAITMNFVLGVALSLTVTGATTGAYLAAHRSGAALGAMALITAAGARYAALHWWSSDAVVLGAVTLAVAVVLVVGVLAVPTLLTPRLRHFVDAVLALAPQIRIVRVVRRRVAPARQLPGTVPPRRPDADR